MQIKDFITNLTNLSDSEIATWLKEVKKNGLTDNETSELTLAMTNSGTVLDWKGLEPTIDKHSTGGIGDKVTLLFSPLIAAYGINVPKLSGRSLGITGGTIDKLESIEGFKTNLTSIQMKEQVKKIGLCIASASLDLAPLEKKLYSIRDVTDTIDSIPLIASSIMSKKFASGSKNIILDVKFGSGAFMKTQDSARLLAKSMVEIGKRNNRKVKVVITNMNQPLGYAIGNILEIKEVVDVLCGKEVNDLIEITITLAKEAITLLGLEYKEEKLIRLLLKGEALRKFEEMVTAQSGDLKSIYKKDKIANYIELIKSNKEGYIQNINALPFGEATHFLGAGRKAATDKIDYSVGIVFHKKYSDKVNIGDPLFEIHARSKKDLDFVKDKLTNSITFGQIKPSTLKLIEEVIE